MINYGFPQRRALSLLGKNKQLWRIMRLTSFFLLVTCLSISLASVSQTVTLKVHRHPLPEVLATLEQQTGFRIMYNDRFVKPSMLVSLDVQGRPVEQVLEQLLAPERLTYHVEGKTIAIRRKAAGRSAGKESMVSFQQERTISGRVTDERGSPLEGVNVTVKGTSTVAATNSNGEYKITVSKGAEYMLFTIVGFESMERVIENHNLLNVSMSASVSDLEEVVVVGYGTQRRRDMTGAVSRVDPKQNETNPNINAVQNLRGTVAGVRVTDTGRPGADGTIRIRGNTSISAEQAPLIILDGIIYTGGLSDINSNDIESMDILKDASSAAIYGSRASNGVILITTKMGKGSKPAINYNGYYGQSDYARTPKLMGPERYLQMKEDVAAYLGRPAVLNPVEEANLAAGRTIDPWEVIAQDAPMHNHELSVSGATDKVRYYVSGSYSDISGRIAGDNFGRISSRINLDVAITDWLTIGTNTGFTKKDYSGVRANLSAASYLSPYSSIFHEDGSLKYLPMDDGLAPNPVFGTLRNDNKTISNTLFSNVYAEVALPLKGLTYRLNTGNNLRFNEEASFSPSYNQDGMDLQGEGRQANRKHHYLTVENILKYARNIADNHDVGITLLYSMERTLNVGNSLSANNVFSDVLSYHGLGIGENFNITTTAEKSTANSVMARLNYRFLDRYMLDLTIRRDGYSAFGVGRKYGNFPSAGIGWLMSEEPFIQQISWLDDLKLRFSYGRNGNRGVDPYVSLANMIHTGNQYVFGDNGTTSIGVVLTSMANPSLGWETTEMMNLGVDFGIANNRVSGAVEFYATQTANLLLAMSIPNITGFPSILTNIGATRNKGIEVTLNSSNIAHRDFMWTTNLVYTVDRQKISSLTGKDADGDGMEDDDIASGWFIGHPLGTNFDYVMDGIWQEGDDFSVDPNAQPGFLRFRDVNGDGRIGPEDRQILHSNQPRFFAGLTNRFAYKNVAFSFAFNAVVGGQSPNAFLNHGTNYFDRTNLMDIPYWTPEHPRDDRPSIGYPNPLGYRFYQSRSFVRLQDVSLSYSLPISILSKVNVNRLNVYVSGKNLHTWTDWLGWDPEHGSGGRGASNGPLLKSWVAGLMITL